MSDPHHCSSVNQLLFTDAYQWFVSGNQRQLYDRVYLGQSTIVLSLTTINYRFIPHHHQLSFYPSPPSTIVLSLTTINLGFNDTFSITISFSFLFCPALILSVCINFTTSIASCVILILFYLFSSFTFSSVSLCWLQWPREKVFRACHAKKSFRNNQNSFYCKLVLKMDPLKMVISFQKWFSQLV